MAETVMVYVDTACMAMAHGEAHDGVSRSLFAQDGGLSAKLGFMSSGLM